MTSHRDPDCLFCKIIEGTIPAQKIAQTETYTAFSDISPQAPTHVLVIPNTHTPNLTETLDPAILANVLKGVQEVVKTLQLSHYRTIINTGTEAGQSVFHLHLHILAGRPFQWPPG